MAATRLPGKPLLKINDLSIVSHVFKKAEEANIGEVVVATEDQEILEDVLKNGGKAVLTRSDHKTGTDRIFEAYKKLNVKDVNYILNLQGDEPDIDKDDIVNLNNLMINNQSEIGTLAAKILDDKILDNKDVVKVITENKLEENNFPMALDFSRKNLSMNSGNIYHHIGIYSYKVNALEKFVSLEQTNNEKENKLEQLRALDNELKINIGLAKSSPIGVDTKEDYLAIKKLWNIKYKMGIIYFQGSFGAYSHLAALKIEPNAKIIPCKTFDECFLKASSESGSRILIPESNRITGNIGIEYLIFKYRLNIYAEHFQKIEHYLLGQSGAKLSDIKDVFSHAQALSQCSKFIKKNNIDEHIRADTAGSAETISRHKIKSEAAIASSLSAKIYKLKILTPNIENESNNATRFLLMGKKVSQPEFSDKKYITSFLFKLKSKPAALYQSLGGFAINGVNLTKLQSYPEQNSFGSYFFLCDLDGHIEDQKVQKSLEELGLHCQDFHVLGVFEADKFREK